MVKVINDLSAFNAAISSQALTVVDFYADWCGPCRQIAPFFEELSNKYPMVQFIKVNTDDGDIAAARGIRAMPTFQFFIAGNMVFEMKGANPQALEAAINEHKVEVNPFANSTGYKLASSSSNEHVPPVNQRQARLAALDRIEKTSKVPVPASLSLNSGGSSSSGSSSNSQPMDIEKTNDVKVEDEDAEIAKAIALSMQETNNSNNVKVNNNNEKVTIGKDIQDARDLAECEAEYDAANHANDEWDEEMVPVPVNEEHLALLLSMDFSDTRARKGLINGGSFDGAVEWITNHQDDPDIDQPYMVRKRDTIPKQPLTEEEKQKKMAAVKDLIKKRKEQREVETKKHEIQAEKERRSRGQQMDETLEERQRLMRKREADRLKKEKEDTKRERERLKQEIERDKELRRLNKGVIPSVLGVDGYNPSIIQYDVDNPAPPDSSTTNPVPPTVIKKAADPTPLVKKASDTPSLVKKSSEAPNPAQIDTYISTISKYRTANDGGNALKLISTFLQNIINNPNEEKYRSINTESSAFKTKLTPLVGPLSLLRAVGFEKNDDGKLVYKGEINQILRDAADKVKKAEETYFK